MIFDELAKKYEEAGFDDFHNDYTRYNNLKPFKISENVEVSGEITDGTHFIMRTIAQYHLEACFRAMKIDMDDPNVSGDKGTPYRIIKMWTGHNLDDSTELMSGRWAKKPRIATFPNDSKSNFPITKRVDIVSLCSHHSAPFSTLFGQDSYAIVSYIPRDYVLGISKLQRIVDWVARRGHLQENLTKIIHEEVTKVSKSLDVYVGLFNLKHTCEWLRGSQTNDGAFTSEYYSGEFNKPEVRQGIKK